MASLSIYLGLSRHQRKCYCSQYFYFFFVNFKKMCLNQSFQGQEININLIYKHNVCVASFSIFIRVLRQLLMIFFLFSMEKIKTSAGLRP